ncbi:hypothetical protein JW979_05950 [bacterium]|nr:hypothetical protein [candidate division CSSED10-310 bacterium]
MNSIRLTFKLQLRFLILIILFAGSCDNNPQPPIKVSSSDFSEAFDAVVRAAPRFGYRVTLSDKDIKHKIKLKKETIFGTSYIIVNFQQQPSGDFLANLTFSGDVNHLPAPNNNNPGATAGADLGRSIVLMNEFDSIYAAHKGIRDAILIATKAFDHPSVSALSHLRPWIFSVIIVLFFWFVKNQIRS